MYDEATTTRPIGIFFDPKRKRIFNREMPNQIPPFNAAICPDGDSLFQYDITLAVSILRSVAEFPG